MTKWLRRSFDIDIESLNARYQLIQKITTTVDNICNLILGHVQLSGMFWQQKYTFYKISMALDSILKKMYETIVVKKMVEPWNVWFIIINCICSCNFIFGFRWRLPDIRQDDFFGILQIDGIFHETFSRRINWDLLFNILLGWISMTRWVKSGRCLAKNTHLLEIIHKSPGFSPRCWK